MRVFLDANVLFSASNHPAEKPSNIARLINLLLQRGEAVTSDFALEEARRNITLKRPGWIDQFNALHEEIRIIPSVCFDLPVTLGEKDRPILCAAIRAGCEYLVTGDRRDFGHLYNHDVEGVTIIDLTTLAELLTGS